MNNQSLEVVLALIVASAFAVERLAEMFGAPVFAALSKSGIKADSKDVRTAVMVLLVTVLNGLIIYGFDLDFVSQLMEQNPTIATVLIAAFGATGVSSIAHNLVKYKSGEKSNLIDALEIALRMIKESGTIVDDSK